MDSQMSEELPPDLGELEIETLCWQQELSNEQLIEQAHQYLHDDVSTLKPDEEALRAEADAFFEQIYSTRPLSPTSERYRQKHQHLAEKYEFIEAETSMLRKRVKDIRKQCAKLTRMKRSLCHLLDQHGDTYYKAYLEIDDEEPIASTPFDLLTPGSYVRQLELTPQPLPVQQQQQQRKRSRPGTSKTSGLKSREMMMTPEQREEEERARQKIVSIIDSVFSESKKASENKQQQQQQQQRPVGNPREPLVPLPAEKPQVVKDTVAEDKDGNNGKEKEKKPEERHFIPYKRVQLTEAEQKERMSRRVIDPKTGEPRRKRRRKMHTGVVAGISYTFLSNESETDTDDDENEPERPPSAAKESPNPQVVPPVAEEPK